MRFLAAMVAFFGALLWLDRYVTRPEQLLLGAAAWVVLVVALRPFTPERRAQALVVVVVATCFEVLGSIVWGVYSYRLGNLPTFVPPCHGLVYLTGLRLSVLARRHVRALILAAGACAWTWALLGVTVLPRRDMAGLAGVAVFTVFLARGRNRAVYAGVFFAVAALELYGTAIGTWRWAAEIPGLGVRDGNPPSGAASGYIFFDIAALALAPWLLDLFRRSRLALSPAA